MRAVLSVIKGSLVFFGYVINTLFWSLPLFCLSLIKLVPLNILRNVCTYALDFCASCWISCNGLMDKLFNPIKMNITGNVDLSPKEWYMLIANHQSWVDILILQQVFNRKIPFLKFFLKKELMFVPVLGLAWWALDFPFMRRYSTAQLKRNPRLKGKDIEITKKACGKFKNKPVCIMNFVEGTRFTPVKHAKQNSPFKYLLRPKAGGLAFAISAMGDQIGKLIDVTIYYPAEIPSFWHYISGKVKAVHVNIKVRDITESMRGDYIKDKQFKNAFQHQLNEIWQDKDELLEQQGKVRHQGKEVII